MNKILVVDDELSIRESFSLILDGRYKVVTAASGEGALKAVTDQKIDLAYLDIRMPGLDGLETLKRMKEIDPAIEVIMVTAVNEVNKASAAIKLGARDYIIKPFDVDAIVKMTAAILRRKDLQREGAALQKKGKRLIGQSDKIAALNKTIETIAPQSGRALIVGEPGTEKETVAEMIHEKSPRRELPFIIFDLSPAMSKTGIKLALFGQEKGLTTADLEKTKGLLEQARAGTLLINNVEFLPVEILPQLQSTEVRLLGSSSEPDLPEPVAKFFAETAIVLPALRDRITDLPFLVKELLEEISAGAGREMPEVEPVAEELMSSYNWPGNTRQLQRLLERIMLVSSGGRITEEELPFDLLLLSSDSPGSDYLARLEQYFPKNN